MYGSTTSLFGQTNFAYEEQQSLYGLGYFGLNYYGDLLVPPIPSTPFFIGFGVSGKLGKDWTSDPLNVRGIYQMRMTKRGKRPVKMKFYAPTNPQTETQQANRAKFAAAMVAWQALSTGDKAVYNERAKKRNMFGWGLFIREYYQSNP